MLAAQPPGRKGRRKAVTRPDAGHVRKVQRVAGEVPVEPDRSRREARRRTTRRSAHTGRTVRGGQGVGRRVHDCHGGEHRGGDRGGSRMPRAGAPRFGRRGHRDPHAWMTHELDQHFFRHEYGRLVAMLSRRVGIHHLEAVEDSVQCALLAALESWTMAGLPDNPSAWLFRVADNHLLGELRQRARRDRLLAQRGLDDTEPTAIHATPALAGDVRDDLLRMLFFCCDDSIPIESQLVIALKTLCGFDVREIAERLFISEANVYKRLGRARNRLQQLPLEPDDLPAEKLASRLPAVQLILYVL